MEQILQLENGSLELNTENKESKSLDHMIRLESINPVYKKLSPFGNLSFLQLKQLLDANLCWFVDSTFGNKFKYIKELHGQTEKTTEVYTGDLPDWVIDRIETALSLSIEFITIHSNTPLPETARPVEQDPLVIGWFSNGCITDYNVENNSFGGKWVSHVQDGVVLAFWGDDAKNDGS